MGPSLCRGHTQSKAKSYAGTKLIGGSCLVAVALMASIGLDAGPAQSKPKEFHSKTNDVNTQDPAVNNFNIGRERMKSSDWDGAIDSFLQATYFARNNYYPQAYYCMGLCYKLKGQDTKAIEAFKTNIQQNIGPSPDTHVELGEVYMRNDRDDEAEQEFDKAIIGYQGPGPRAHNALGKLMEKRGDLDNANWQFKTALGYLPWNYTVAWMNYGENYMKKQNWGDALLQFLTIKDRADAKTLTGVDYAQLWLDIGVCRLAKGDHQGALEAWQQCSMVDAMMAAPHLYLATMFDQEKHISSAIKEYQTYIALTMQDPKGPDKGLNKVKDRLTYLEHQLEPKEVESAPAKPSPYMRQQMQKDLETQQALGQKQREQMESLSGPTPKDSGF